MFSIKPDSGWEEPRRPQALAPQVQRDPTKYAYVVEEEPARPTQRSYLQCKVCERGTLLSKNVFRMSPPVVLIGFLLLVPCVSGMIFCGLGALGSVGTGAGLAVAAANSDDVAEPPQSAGDAAFRSNCARSFAANYRASAGVSPNVGVVEQFCECGLAVYKETSSQEIATDSCTNRLAQGTLAAVSAETADLYTRRHYRSAPGKSLALPAFLSALGVIGGGFFLAGLVACFVGGLLGWLLVMRKRVLQCSFCGAVVNAS